MAATNTLSSLDVSTLTAQLHELEQLTQTEAQIARIRVPQARTDAVRRELRQNGENAVRRAHRISGALRELDAVPDVIAPAIGRLFAIVRSTLEQAQPLDEALLGDLALEHQLLDRARYLRVLAEHADRREIMELADDLVAAHSATVDWLTTVLAEEALGGPSALIPTPLQRVTGGINRMATLPARFAVERVNRAVDTVARTSGNARETVQEVTGKLLRFGSDTVEVAEAGRDAVLERTERVADREGADNVASIARDTRTEMGSLKASELPVQHYEEMTAAAAISAVRELDDPEEIRAMITFEESHKNRSGVVSAAQNRLAGIAKDAVPTPETDKPGAGKPETDNR